LLYVNEDLPILKQMGKWLGITKEGRFAALTNYRDLKNEQSNKVSRGEIVRSFLTGQQHAQAFLHDLRNNKKNYNGFNVLVGTTDELYYYGNRQENIVKIDAGSHSISNHLLNTPWPKVAKARRNLREYVMNTERVDVERLFEQLNDHEHANDDLLPNTGVGLELERELSPVFIKTENYETW